jgi:signal transduction histidine kinase
MAVALTVVCTLRQLWTTDLGMDERLVGDERVVTEVDVDGPAARVAIVPGDVIVRDPGLITYVKPWTEREIHEWNHRLHRAIESGVVPVVIRHEGVERTVEIRPHPAPNLSAGLRQLRRLAPYFPTCLAFLGVAALLAWPTTRSKRVERSANEAAERARAIIVVSFACYGPCWVIEWMAPGWPAWLYVVSSALDTASATAACLLQAYFAWSYPTKAAWIDRPWIRRPVLGVAVFVTAIAFFNTLGFIDVPRAAHGHALAVEFDSVVVIVSLVGFGWQYMKAEGIVARRQAAWILGGASLAMLVPILGLIIPQYIFGTGVPMMHFILFQFPMLLPLGVAVAVGRYRLFALDGIALRVGPYAVMTVTALVVCITVTAAVQMVLGWRTGTVGEASRWVGVVVALVIGEPLRRFAQRAINRLFSRDPDAFIRRCAVLSARLARTEDEETMGAEIAAGLETASAALLDLERVLPNGAAASVGRALADGGVLRTRDIRDDAAVDVLHERGVALLVAVPSDGMPTTSGVRALALSAPSFGPWIGRSERDALASIGLVVGAALAQRETKRVLEAERIRAEEERRHIAMELHDGIGATLTAARIMTRRLREPNVNGGAVTLDALDATLRQGLGDLRTSLWSLDSKNVEWDALLAEVRRNASDVCAAAGVEMEMVVEGATDVVLSSGLRLAIFRIVQEAVINAIKHAAPSRIELLFRATSDMIEVVIGNDGGSMSPESMSHGHGLLNMTRRIEALGGRIRFAARDAGGTRVVVQVPSTAPPV